MNTGELEAMALVFALLLAGVGIGMFGAWIQARMGQWRVARAVSREAEQIMEDARVDRNLRFLALERHVEELERRTRDGQ